LFNVDYIENWILLKQTNKNLSKYLNKLKKCDILIYQPLKEKHGKLSTETENRLRTILKQNCKLISFPYIYNSAFWPFFHSGSIDEEFYPGISGKKLANKEVIISLLNRYNNFTENYHKMQDSSYHTSKNMWPITKQSSEALNLNYYDKYAKHFWKNILVKIIKYIYYFHNYIKNNKSNKIFMIL